jgi:hypothetical protein
MAGLVAANSSLLLAALLYMGWAYTSALYGYFHISPLDLGVGVQEYVLRSLSLFSPAIVIAAAALIAVTTARAWHLDLTRLTALASRAAARAPGPLPRLAATETARKLRTARGLLITAGTAVTAGALALAWLAGHVPISTYLLLTLLGSGPLILALPTRADPCGRFPYALAVIVAAVCALWAGSLYASNLGTRAAQSLVRGLPAGTAVAVYSTQLLALSGPGITVQHLPPAYLYHYRYEGLRLLTTRSGTYYLLPVGWSPAGYDLTYILTANDQTRIEIYSGQRRSSP